MTIPKWRLETFDNVFARCCDHETTILKLYTSVFRADARALWKLEIEVLSNWPHIVRVPNLSLFELEYFVIHKSSLDIEDQMSRPQRAKLKALRLLVSPNHNCEVDGSHVKHDKETNTWRVTIL